LQDFKDKVAVITGGASGIGRALADRAVREGMKIVLADVEREPLLKAEAELSERGAQVLAVETDVSKSVEIERLAEKAVATFGGVNLLFNNAGVVLGGRIWENTADDWDWIIGVNLMGVIHGVRIFVPIMEEQGDECHIVNTASMAGLVSGPKLGAYKVTKFGVVALSETLYYELGEAGSKIGVSVLCPGFIRTQINISGRNRPDGGLRNLNPDAEESELLNDGVAGGKDPSDIADYVFEGIKAGKLFLLPHEGSGERVTHRAQEIVAEVAPSLVRPNFTPLTGNH
jgi:NAD(P)-dependent dehydrogenase (short-subunit alcohol dehydrogenase family)